MYIRAQPSYTRSRARHGRHKALSWYVEGWWREIIEQLLERVYLLRCQLIHGAATFGSRLNRTALKHCASMMGLLMPAILLVWIDRGADEDWGLMCYPPLEGRGVKLAASTSTPRPSHDSGTSLPTK